MVMQSELIDLVLSKLDAGVFTMEFGESATVDYTDNALTTVHATISDTTHTISTNKFTTNTILPSTTGNTNTMNACLLKIDGSAVKKMLFTPVTKDTSVIMQIKTNCPMITE